MPEKLRLRAFLEWVKLCHFDRSEAKWRNLLSPPNQTYKATAPEIPRRFELNEAGSSQNRTLNVPL